MTFSVTPDEGEPYELTAGSRDVLTWERAGKGRSFGGFAENLHMVDLYGLAFVAARRQGMWAGTLPEFEAANELMPKDDDEDAEPDPTPAARSAAPS